MALDYVLGEAEKRSWFIYMGPGNVFKIQHQIQFTFIRQTQNP